MLHAVQHAVQSTATLFFFSLFAIDPDSFLYAF